MNRKKTQLSTQVDGAVVDAVRATVAGLQRIVGPTVTLSSWVTEALVEHLRASEARYNDGKPFTDAPEHLVTGPRIRTSTHPQS